MKKMLSGLILGATTLVLASTTFAAEPVKKPQPPKAPTAQNAPAKHAQGKSQHKANKGKPQQGAKHAPAKPNNAQPVKK